MNERYRSIVTWATPVGEDAGALEAWLELRLRGAGR
jgi:hypothetical protein